LAKTKIIKDIFAKIDQIKYDVEIYRLLWEGESSHLRTIAFRCISRSHQILSNSLPHIPLPAEQHRELKQLSDELEGTTIYLQISYVTANDPCAYFTDVLFILNKYMYIYIY